MKEIIGGRACNTKRFFLRIGFLLAVWVLLYAIFFLFGRLQGSSFTEKEVDTSCSALTNSSKSLHGFGYIQRDHHNNFRTVYSIHIDKVDIRFGRVGTFQTALSETLILSNLRLEVHSYSDAVECSTDQPSSQTRPFETNNTQEQRGSPDSVLASAGIQHGMGWSDFLSVFSSPTFPIGRQKLVADVSIPTASNIATVEANDFSCRHYQDGAEALKITSKKAYFNTERKEVVLRGHVQMTSTDGTVLESNHVRWDVRNNTFTAHDGYTILRNNNRSFGESLCVDALLRPAGLEKGKQWKGKEEWSQALSKRSYSY